MDVQLVSRRNAALQFEKLAVLAAMRKWNCANDYGRSATRSSCSE